MFGEEISVVEILQIGVIGLGFLLAVLAYNLLTKEQKQNTPRSDILKSIYIFMSFSVVLCIIGIVSQIFDIKKKDINPPPKSSSLETNNVLYNYFPYTDSDNPLFCNDGKFEYSEQKTSDVDTNYIQGMSTATLTGKDNRSIVFNIPTHGYKSPYYLKMAFPNSVAFLEHKNRVYQGYVLVEFDEEAGLKAVICPMVSSPRSDDKGLSTKEAKAKWLILNESCQPLASIKEIYK
jgi:hypothetical protein